MGRSSCRAAVRATASPAILHRLYVGSITRWLSPSGSVSFRAWWPAGGYTAVDEQCRNAFAFASARMSSPLASAFAARSRSKSFVPPWATAKFRT